MPARLYQPARNAMTSGTAGTKRWILEFVSGEAREIDPLMGWTSSADTQAQVRLVFDTREEAVAYARDKGIDFVATKPRRRGPNIRPGGYGDNFATNRRGSWTH